MVQGNNIEFIEYFDHDKEIKLKEKGLILDIKNSPIGYKYLIKFNNLEKWLYEFQIQKI